MQVKTFEGFSSSEIMKKIKSEFGKNAVILSKKEKKIDSSGAKVIQVKAAVEEEERQGASSTREQTYTQNELEEKLDNLSKRFDLLFEYCASDKKIQSLENHLQELKMITLQNMYNHQNTNSSGSVPKKYRPIVDRLTIMGVESAYIMETVKFLENQDFDVESPRVNEAIRDYAMKWIYQNISIYPKITSDNNMRQVHYFVGQPGVGKTYTVAKLSSYLHKKLGITPFCISLDNRKFAAGEILAIHSKIQGSPYAMIEKIHDLDASIQQNKHCPVVLVDCGGFKPEQLKEFRKKRMDSRNSFTLEGHLVLALTEQSLQMDRSIHQYSEVGIQSLVFTKLESGWTFGEIYNQAYRHKIPLSFFSTGSEIPHTFELATRERVIERIFGIES